MFPFTRTVLVFSLPVSFSLCLEHVDHWELIASRGDRPSHPICPFWGLRPAKPYESSVCNCFVFSTGTSLFDSDKRVIGKVRYGTYRELRSSLQTKVP